MKLKIKLFNKVIELCLSQYSYKNDTIKLPKIIKTIRFLAFQLHNALVHLKINQISL